jgi:hypothetical protein
LILQYDEPLSNFAFNFNLRRYNVGTSFEAHMNHRGCFPAADVDLGAALVEAGIVDAGTPLPASAALMGFRLHHAVTDVTVSVRLMMVQVTQLLFEARSAWLAAQGVDFNHSFFVPEIHPVFGVALHMHEVGRCRLTVSKPVLKAPLVSAVETKM